MSFPPPPQRPELKFTATQVRTITKAKDGEIAHLKALNETLMEERNAALVSLQNIQNVQEIANTLRYQAQDRTAVSVWFRPHFSAVRIRNQPVYIVLVRSESMDRAMWDFADRTGKFVDCLHFSVDAKVITRTDTVVELGLHDGSVIDVEFTGDETTRLSQPEPA